MGDRSRPQERLLESTFKSGTYPGMLYGIVLHDYPKQVLSLAMAKSVPANMREFLSWAQRHYRIDVTASTVQTQDKWASICRYVSRRIFEEFSHNGSNAHFIRLTYRSERRTSPAAARPSNMFPSTHGPQGQQRTLAKDVLYRLWNSHRFCSA